MPVAMPVPEPLPVPAGETRRVERKEADVVTRRQVYRRISTKTEVEEPVGMVDEVEAVIPEPAAAGEVEALPAIGLFGETLPEGELEKEEEEEEEEEAEEEELRLRRVVRRPVHVTSRRTVIRKLVAASEEQKDEVEEVEDEDRVDDRGTVGKQFMRGGLLSGGLCWWKREEEMQRKWSKVKRRF